MGSVPFNYSNSLSEGTANLLLRQVVSLTAVFIHISLFWGNITPALWPLLIFQGLIYAPLMHILPYFKQSASNALLVDAAIYGFCIGIWGLNPILAAGFISSANIISMAAGGPRFCLMTFSLMIIAIPIGATLQGWDLRMEIPFTTLIITASGMIFFMTSLGLRVYNINTRLRQTRGELRQQRQELIDLNQLALAVNTQLEIDDIMSTMMNVLKKQYPFEALYILGWDQDNSLLKVQGVYGDGITDSEKAVFSQLTFDPQQDSESIFIRGLVNNNVLHLPRVNPQKVISGPAVDKRVFDLKPTVSVAYFPIAVEERIVGGACFANYQRPFHLTSEDLLRIERNLVQVGTALRNSALINQLEQAVLSTEEALRRAEASEQAKGRFLANVSHEIRTPLTAIMGYSEALEDIGITPKERSQFVRHILRSGSHLLSIINDILDISKIEADKIELERMEFDLVQIICDIESYLALRTREKALSLSIEADYPLPKTLYNDPTRLKQILLNLCNNAIKFTPSGGVTLRLRMLDRSDLSIEVTDTGIGIEEHDQQRIFNAFDQADTSTTRLFGGTGLGLFISKNLAQLMGGDLSVESRPAKGSTFRLRVPLGSENTEYIRDHDELAAAIKDIRTTESQSHAPLLSGRVLVAEDNLQNQRLVKRLIEQTGMGVDTVDDGLKAIQALESKQYVVVLMDMQMPHMGGVEASREIRRKGIKTPIIAFTANVMRHQLTEYRALGIEDVLEKPISRALLFETLQKYSLRVTSTRPRVLIVDDNEVNQMILFRYVSKAKPNAEIILEKNGSQAVDRVCGEAVDLIFMDLHMPVMDGLRATREIREAGYNIPIYIVSGNIEAETITLSAAAGANGHLAKPLEKAKIYDILDKSLSS